MSIYLRVGHIFLGMRGAKIVRQCHQNDLVVHLVCFVFDKALFFFIFAETAAWCRRELFDIGYSLFVDSEKKVGRIIPPNIPRIIPPMQHALLTPGFSETTICICIYKYIYIC